MDSIEDPAVHSNMSELLAEANSLGLLPTVDQVEDQSEAYLQATLNLLQAVTFHKDHHYDKFEFWDARKVKGHLATLKPELLKIPKPVIQAIKHVILSYSKPQIDHQFEREAIEGAYQPPEVLSGEVLLPRDPRTKKFPSGSKKVIKSVEKSNPLESICNDKLLCYMWETRNKPKDEKL